MVTCDYLAAHTYDTVNLLVYAIKKAGLDRAKIRDTVKELSSWNGVTGAFNWNAHGANTREVQLGTITNGHVVSVSELPGLD
jgi:ABC-type branched-subunit amino acid transport system substrate-binding protein